MKYKVLEIKEDGTRTIDITSNKEEAIDLAKKYNAIGQYWYAVIPIKES